MAQQPFNTDGVIIKTQELYSQSHDSLRAETESLRVDFKSWMHRHFDLNEEQSRFLESMAYPDIQILAEDLADCILFRLPLTVKFPVGNPIGSKYVMPMSTIVRLYGPGGVFSVIGELTIEIVYK
jgi:hypothetical protein